MVQAKTHRFAGVRPLIGHADRTPSTGKSTWLRYFQGSDTALLSDITARDCTPGSLNYLRQLTPSCFPGATRAHDKAPHGGGALLTEKLFPRLTRDADSTGPRNEHQPACFCPPMDCA